MFEQITEQQILLRLSLAMVVGMLIGIDSWYNRRNASIRIYCVVAVTSAMTMMLIANQTGNHPEAFSRVLAGLITGFGFLGGGIIMRQSETHQLFGLTTAATIWGCGLIGACLGAGQYSIAAHATVAMIMVLYINLDSLMQRIGIRRKSN
ncbi:MAG: MgtC/SapB family protein [Gammaproteobacteria bacterium]|jgi:putative Mg2+ transporter-C (MgtC) family protein|nr:MgtC/SapB family protein [Gammaproteobacteria bacterium]